MVDVQECAEPAVSQLGRSQICLRGWTEFDGHKVNFDEAMKRQMMYKSEEGRAILKTRKAILIMAAADSGGGDN